MISLLSQLVTFFTNIGVYLLNAVIDAINLLVVAIGALLTGLLALLPTMPSPPNLGQSVDWIGWLNFFVPVGGLLAGLATFVLLWTTFLAIRVALAWAKGV